MRIVCDALTVEHRNGGPTSFGCLRSHQSPQTSVDRLRRCDLGSNGGRHGGKPSAKAGTRQASAAIECPRATRENGVQNPAPVSRWASPFLWGRQHRSDQCPLGVGKRRTARGDFHRQKWLRGKRIEFARRLGQAPSVQPLPLYKHFFQTGSKSTSGFHKVHGALVDNRFSNAHCCTAPSIIFKLAIQGRRGSEGP